MLQERGNTIASLCVVAAQPLNQGTVKGVRVLLRRFGADQLGKDIALCRGVKAADDEVGDCGCKAFGIGRPALSAADAREIGGVVVDAAPDRIR